jgi:hypothetical protein
MESSSASFRFGLSSGWLRLSAVAARRLRQRRAAAGCLAAAGLAIAALWALVGTGVFEHPGRAVVGFNPSSDFQIMAWSLEWWPWAIGHGVNPFHTTLLWPPGGFSTVWITSMPVPALFASPITLTAGPLAAYNVLMLAAVVLATAAAYLLCHQLTGRVAPSIVGALLFGLSPYMLGHMMSQHLDLTLVFPLPLLALVGVRYGHAQMTRRRFTVLFSLLLVILLGSSLELFSDVTLLLAICGAIALLVARGDRRRLLARLGVGVVGAYACCLPVLILLGVLGLGGTHGPLQSAPSGYAVDLWNLVVPTPTVLLGSVHWARALSGRFVGNIGERDGYVGVPLLVVCALALRAEWKRGAWLAGLLGVVALVASLGPVLVLGGRQIVSLPISVSRLPVFADALPARLSLFVALGCACLCSLWLARPGHRLGRLLLGGAVLVSLLPNFWPARRLPHAWPVSSSFAWSRPTVPAALLNSRQFPEIVRPGATLLVLPTRDRTAASYWQAETGMRFRLAMPETPFIPEPIAAEPTIAKLADDVLPQLDGGVLGAARLRALLLANRIDLVAVTGLERRRWARLARLAAAAAPIDLRGTLFFAVRDSLRPLIANGGLITARAGDHPARRIRAWIHFDGARGLLRTRVQRDASSAVTTLSSAGGDADAPWVAINTRGQAAVAFTEWRAHHLSLRVATDLSGGWHAVTLDIRRLPIWSPRVAITDAGTVVATWVDDEGASRLLRTAVRRKDGSWQIDPALDRGQGLGAVALRGGADHVLLAWHDSQASIARVRAAIYTGGGWTEPRTLASSFALLDDLAIIDAGNDPMIGWRLWNGHPSFYAARLRGHSWGPAVAPRSRLERSHKASKQ